MSSPTLPRPRSVAEPYRICFICTGNICRSPMADVVLRHLVGETSLHGRLAVSSAGTGPWHEGEPMDRRAAQVLKDNGYVDHGHVAHQFNVTEVEHLDAVVALDRRHQQTVAGLARGRDLSGRLVLLRSFDRSAGGSLDVPDPYYGDTDDFARCLSMVERGCHGLVSQLEEVLAEVPGRRRGTTG